MVHYDHSENTLSARTLIDATQYLVTAAVACLTCTVISTNNTNLSAVFLLQAECSQAVTVTASEFTEFTSYH